MQLAILLFLTIARPAGAHDITALVSRVHDLRATVTVTHCDPKALESIGPDFGTPYRFRKLTLYYKSPDRVRLETKSSFLSAVMIENGPVRFFSVPKLHQKKTEHLDESPSRRLSLLEYGGMLSPDTLTYLQGNWVRSEAVAGAACDVYDMRFRNTPQLAYRLWIDPETNLVRKREWFDIAGKVKATFLYLGAQSPAEGCWAPKSVEVRNADGVLAASADYDDVRANTGIADDLFTPGP